MQKSKPDTKGTAPDRSRPVLSNVLLNVLSATFIMAAYNNTLWGHAYTLFGGNYVLIAVFGAAIWALTLLILSVFGFRWLQKPLIVFMFITAAVTSYYMDTLGILIDRDMIQNAMTTTFTESKHLITQGFITHVLLYGIVPSLIVLWVRVRPQTIWRNLLVWVGMSVVSLALFAGFTMSNFKTFSAVVREHRELLGSYQPGAAMGQTLRYAKMMMRSQNIVVAPLGVDAKKGPLLLGAGKPVLTVVYAGETARAQSFSLGGYGVETNPELAKPDIVYFTNVTSCGTATATSLPCMFSVYTREEYSFEKGLSTENLLDVMTHAGVKAEWLDNNTGDKNIADRVPRHMVLDVQVPEFCNDGECTDGIFLGLLKDFVAKMTEDTVLVLHQGGSHGPAYHVRYPKEYERFTPACQTGEFKNCTDAEIRNAYDNTILYTDHVLAEAIDYLAGQDKVISAMYYVSDHGESLGENGLYLHGAPYFMAPEFQTHVPMVMWLSEPYRAAFKVDEACLKAKSALPLSHDNLFHTVLGMMDIKTEVRQDALDLMADCHTAP